MREILFRGKQIDTGEWVYGNYMTIYEMEQYKAIQTAEIDTPREIIKVDPKTVGQYTGLIDSNGKKIFEGDIVICEDRIDGNQFDLRFEIGYVELLYGAFRLHGKLGYYSPFKDWLEYCGYEVVGNIFDNPELLHG